MTKSGGVEYGHYSKFLVPKYYKEINIYLFLSY